MFKQDKVKSFITLIVLTVILLRLQTVYAQEQIPTPSEDQVNAIAKQMYCPVCENIPLDVCNTQACAQWRDLIREKLTQGWTETQIKAYFVEQYGDRVLAVPPITSGSSLNILIYAIPALVLFAGIIYLIRAILRGKSERSSLQTNRPHDITPEQEKVLSELEDELERKKAEGPQ